MLLLHPMPSRLLCCLHHWNAHYKTGNHNHKATGINPVLTKQELVAHYLPLGFQLLVIFVRCITRDLSAPKGNSNDCVSDTHDKQWETIDKGDHNDVVPAREQH